MKGEKSKDLKSKAKQNNKSNYISNEYHIHSESEKGKRQKLI